MLLFSIVVAVSIQKLENRDLCKLSDMELNLAVNNIVMLLFNDIKTVSQQIKQLEIPLFFLYIT